MASIVKRGKKFSVVYYYTDENGNQQQRWEPPVSTKKEALRRKNEIEYELDTGTFIPPAKVTVETLLNDFVELYGTKKWGLSAYAANTSLIRNYINPILAQQVVQEITPRTVDCFFHQLQTVKPIDLPNRHARTEYITPCTIEKVYKLMRTAFKQAVRWGIIGKNPFDGAVLPKREKKKRAIWDAATIRKALDNCEDAKLYVAMNLSFACSLRLGEITGLTWDCLNITDEALINDDAYLLVEKELARVDQKAINALGNADILFVFPKLMGRTANTRLVLKKPKTESSIRKVWIPKTLACILREWKQKQDALKEMMGDEFIDYNLVLALETGRPCEDRVIGRQFDRLKERANLPDVVFHSLRHSSTTYKLKLNHGDIKATQGDTGHAQPDMVTEVYAHILDEDRKINAQKFEVAFYANPNMQKIEQEVVQQNATPQLDLSTLVQQLQAQPELATTLATLLQGKAR
ncbi:site-specific integrase [Dysosmobacter sp.]